jgi:lipase
VQAERVQPPYVSEEFKTALREQLGSSLTVVELDCDHMVPQAKPADVAALVRELL